MIVVSILILIAGFVLLAKGADFFVDGASAVAGKLHVPGFLIGMTIVAMGTSLPECAVTIVASLRGNNEMAISNVIGSNAFNLLVVCGACALFAPLVIKKSTRRREFPFSILVEVILLVMGAAGMMVGRIEGAILLGIFVLFLVWMVRSTKRAMRSGKEPDSGGASGSAETDGSGDTDGSDGLRELSNVRCVLYLVFGAAAIVFGGWLVVGAAEAFALRLGMSETLVGLTICAIGTSLPELFASGAAARKGQSSMALGNVIGSNIFNVLLVAGVSTVISPIAVTRSNLVDLTFVILVSAVLLLLTLKRQELRRGGGILMLSVYVLYMVFVCLRDTGMFNFVQVL